MDKKKENVHPVTPGVSVRSDTLPHMAMSGPGLRESWSHSSQQALISVRDGITLGNWRYVMCLLLGHVQFGCPRTPMVVLFGNGWLCAVHGEIVRRALLSTQIGWSWLVTRMIRIWRPHVLICCSGILVRGWRCVRGRVMVSKGVLLAWALLWPVRWQGRSGLLKGRCWRSVYGRY